MGNNLLFFAYRWLGGVGIVIFRGKNSHTPDRTESAGLQPPDSPGIVVGFDKHSSVCIKQKLVY